MIQRVYDQACQSNAAMVCVATDDERIAEVVTGFNGRVVMTSDSHTTGTDRIHEAAAELGLTGDDVVVNVQGDEPLIPPQVINQVASLILPSVEMATLCEPILSVDEAFDPNIVKVVMKKEGLALYFSRAPVPYDRDGFPDRQWSVEPRTMYRHLGIYAYTKKMLDKFVGWPEANLESIEKLEQLRVLENGGKIAVAVASVRIPPGIDVPEDLTRTLEALARSELPRDKG